MSEMVERVARAIAAVGMGEGAASEEAVEKRWKSFQSEAVAAIEAMREPTEVMCFVNGPGDQHNYADAAARETWSKMIDAALT